MKKLNLLLQNLNLKPFVILVFFSLFSILSLAQSKIAGKVLDKTTGIPIADVIVFVKGTAIASSTDLDGKYELTVTPGTYEVAVKYIGYKDLLLTGIVVKPNETVVQDIILEETTPDGKELTGAEVVAEARKTSIEAVYIAQKTQVGIGNGTSSDQITKTTAKSVADVITRISGTTIQENKFAIIRGMNDRYNAGYLNGAPLPSTESDRKAFAFNIIPSNLIDNLMIYKSPTPDMLGDFAGGVIMINTKSIPDAKTSVLNFSVGTNSISTFKDFSHFRQSKTDILGFDNGTRKLPEDKNYRSGLAKSEYVDFTKKFNNDWKIYNKQATPNANLSYTWGRSFKHHENSFGTMASFTYANSNKYTQVQQKKFRYEDNILDQDFMDDQYTNNVAFGALLNLAYKFKKKHVVTVKNLFNLSSDDITTTRNGLSSNENSYYSRMYSNIYSQNRIFSTQITGDHLLTSKKHKLNWVLNAGNIFRLMPDYRVASYAGEGNNPAEYGMIINNTLFTGSTGRFYSNMNEKIFSGTANYSIPFKFKFTKNEFKAGVFSQLRNRDFTSRYFTYFGPWGITGTPESNLNESNISEKGVYMVEQSSAARDNYSAVSKLNATYLMMDTRFFTDFRLVYGVRYETYYQKINTADGTNMPLVIDSTYKNFLPSLNFTWNVTEKANVRLSAGKTVNRPEYRELAIFPFFNFNLNSNIAGNPNLQPATIWNYDARWEWFPSNKEVISVGVFYKKIANPIEMSIDMTQVSIRTFTYSNQKSAENYGLELEYRKSFGFITKALDNLTFFTNLSLIKSKIIFSELSSSVDRPLQGQSPYVLNMGLQFNDPKSGWGVNLSYNKIGRRIAFVGAPKVAKFGLDIYENPRTVIDFQLSKSFKKWEYKLTAGDLLAQDLIFYQDINDNGKYDQGSTPADAADNMIFKYKMGYSVTAAIAYKFK